MPFARRISVAVTLALCVACGSKSDLANREQGVGAGGKLKRVAKAIPGRYIVVFEDAAVGTARAEVEQSAGELAAAHGAKVERVYAHALKGFAAAMPEASARAMSANPRVRYVEEDGEVSIGAVQTNATWGIDRLDQRDLPLDQLYSYGTTANGVNAYVIDTGIRLTHSELAGRALSGFDSVNDGYGTNDCNGHGTHVAGTIGGTTYGVAKGVKLYAVRVLDCGGSGSYSGVIAGVDWVTANHVKPAVANMSLGGGASQSADDAVTNSVNAGVVYAIAAGNDNGDACLKSPARTPSAITVGATTSTDARSSFSNYGTCVDIFAPGSSITSSWNTSDTATNTISGTSMATPHVAGAAALYLATNPTAPPAVVADELFLRSTPDKVIGPGPGSPNRLLYSGCVASNDTTPPQVALTAPAGGGVLSGNITLTATATDDGSVTRVEFYANGRLIGIDGTAPYELVWDSRKGSNGPTTFLAKASDLGCNVGTSAPVDITLDNQVNATYDAALQVPRCAAVGSQCDSVLLLDGRAGLGPEANQPNTLGGTCADGISGTYHGGAAIDRINVLRVDGTAFATGKEVRVEVTVWSPLSYSSQRLDLYSAADALNPTWTYLTTLTPAASGAQVLATTFLLPQGGLQAVRASFRYGGTPAECSTGTADDHDDIVFAVGAEPDDVPPAVSVTSPLAGATLSGTVSVSATAADNFGVAAVDFYDGDTLIGTDTSAPYSVSWNTRTATNGTHVLTAKAGDAAGGFTVSSGVTVTLDNDFTPPVVSITAPLPGAVVEEGITVEATASDNRGVYRVMFVVDGTASSSNDYSAPYSTPLWTRYLSNGPHTVVAWAYDAVGNAAQSPEVQFIVNNDIVAPVTAITSPVDGDAVSGTIPVEIAASDDRAVSKVELYAEGVLVGTATTPPYVVSWDSTSAPSGNVALTSRAYDVAGNATDSNVVAVTTNNPGSAAYNSSLQAPVCATEGSRCDTTTLVRGRGNLGPERNAPNTINRSCSDGTSGFYRSDESLERIRVTRLDGSVFAPGKRVRIDVDVWVYSATSDSLDLYFASDALNPSWVYLTTLRPAAAGAQTLSTEYVLPAGTLQAVRGTFRYGGAAAPCTTGSYDDHDDVAFAVAPLSDTAPPVVAITSPAAGAMVEGTVTLAASASDDFDVTQVELYDGATLLATDTAAPYQVSWNTRTAGNGAHVLTAKAYDLAGHVSTSEISVTVNNDVTAPTTSIISPANGARVGQTIPIEAAASDDRAVTRVDLFLGTTLLKSWTTAPYVMSWDTSTQPDGSYTLSTKAYDAAGNVGTSAPVNVTVRQPGVAAYDPVLKAPRCDTVESLCDSKTTLRGRGLLGPEPNQPNTINGSCADSSSGSFHSDESLDRLQVIRADGTALAAGKKVQIIADVWAFSSGNTLNLFYASDATNPTWVYLTTLAPTASGAQILTTELVLPSGGLQAIRGQFNYGGGSIPPSPCINGSYTDHDDLIFAVGQETDAAPPVTAITSPASGITSQASLTLTATADDNFGVTKVEFYAGSTLIGTDTLAPFSATWTAPVSGSYVLTTKAYDAAGHVATSAPVTVQIDAVVPSTAITSPQANAYVRGAVSIQASASDDRGVSRVEIYDGSTLIGTASIAPYIVSWNTAAVTNGYHSLSSRAYDAAGNVGSSSSLYVTVDNAAPTVAITAPVSGAQVDKQVSVTADANDNAQVSKVVFYDGSTLIGTDTSWPYGVTWNTGGIPRGSSHTLTAQAFDPAGNVTTSAAVVVTVR